MKGQVYQVPTAGGLETRLEQAPQNASEVQNWTVDRQTGGWSSRVGYEPVPRGPDQLDAVFSMWAHHFHSCPSGSGWWGPSVYSFGTGWASSASL